METSSVVSWYPEERCESRDVTVALRHLNTITPRSLTLLPSLPSPLLAISPFTIARSTGARWTALQTCESLLAIHLHLIRLLTSKYKLHPCNPSFPAVKFLANFLVAVYYPPLNPPSYQRVPDPCIQPFVPDSEWPRKLVPHMCVITQGDRSLQILIGSNLEARLISTPLSPPCVTCHVSPFLLKVQ